MSGLTLQPVAGEFAVCRLPATAAVPDWIGGGPFSSVTRTADELSVVCPAGAVPAGVRAERGWSLIRVAGPFELDAIGVLVSIAEPLARAGISLLAVGTFDTDYVLVKSARLEQARRVLTAAGHVFAGTKMP
jgi:uncharacterized protein